VKAKCPMCSKRVNVRRDGKVYAHQVFGVRCPGPDLIEKNPAAVTLGRNGGKATAKKLTPDQRSASARRAARARWEKAKGETK
jgi:hypothetical protein